MVISAELSASLPMKNTLPELILNPLGRFGRVFKNGGPATDGQAGDSAYDGGQDLRR
jgi:hypothetical protein